MSNIARFIAMAFASGCGVDTNAELVAEPLKRTCPEEPQLDEQALRQQVFGGAVDVSHPAVVRVAGSPWVLCSGTLITPNRVLTAAHCMCNFKIPQYIMGKLSMGKLTAKDCKGVTATVYPDWNEPPCTNAVVPPVGTAIIKGRVVFHEKMLLVNGDVHENTNDLALIMLERSIDNIIPIEIAGVSVSPLTPVMVVGFGRSVGSYAGTRRQGRMVVTSVSLDTLEAESLPNGTKAFSGGGDSGGALLLEGEDGIERLVGITVYGDHMGLSGFTNAPTYLDWILH